MADRSEPFHEVRKDKQVSLWKPEFIVWRFTSAIQACVSALTYKGKVFSVAPQTPAQVIFFWGEGRFRLWICA